MVPVLKFFKAVGKIFLILLVLLVIVTHHNEYNRRRIKGIQIWSMKLKRKMANMKFILIWHENEDFNCLKTGQEAFLENECNYKNCYVTIDKYLLGKDYRNFDAIILNGKHIAEAKDDLPEKRDVNQTYIFATKESAANYPICKKKFDNYFNLTWTYRLDSDIDQPYFVVKNKEGDIVGPKVNMKWISEPKPVENQIRNIINGKKFTAAWFASNCDTRGGREIFANKLKIELQKYDLNVEVVGSCGSRECPVEKDKECVKQLQKYYFYLAFENSLAEDYVTEKVLKSLLTYSVPIVFGGANYSRFLPSKSYIDGRALGAKKTAATISHLLHNQTAYLEYFNWHNFYTYCLCELLNKRKSKVYTNFRHWWYPNYEKICRVRGKRSIIIASKIISGIISSRCSMNELPYILRNYPKYRVDYFNTNTRF